MSVANRASFQEVDFTDVLRYRRKRLIRQCGRVGRLASGVAVLGVLFPIAVSGQSRERSGGGLTSRGTSADSADRVLAPGFQAGGLRRWLWGAEYRGSWTETVRLPVLDLGLFAGGLRPVAEDSGSLVTTLLLAGNDGRTYVYRPLIIDPTRGLHSILIGSPAGEILRDQVSATLPFAALASQRFQEAAGFSSPERMAFVMPDDPRLGEFREAFAGVAGTLSERPGGHREDDAIYSGFAEVIDGSEVFDRIMGSHEDVVDSRRFLAARLIDLFTGDWSRHRQQWRWGREPGGNVWIPIAKNQDAAFLRLDGVIPSRANTFIRQAVGFEESYPSIVGLHYVAREVDRRFLVDLDRAAWDSVTLATQGALTDDVIDEAIGRLPAPVQEREGEFLRTALRRRRDDLPQASRRFYDILTEDVEVQLTDLRDDVRIRGLMGGRLEVTASAPGAAAPYYERVFDPAETEEVRLHLWGGDDRVVVDGEPEMQITVRLVAGEGDDEVRFEAPLDRVRVYDQGSIRIVGEADVRADREAYDTWVYSADDTQKPVDWGRWVVPAGDVGMSSDYGLFVGGGATWYRYGFRRRPYASRVRFLAGVATQLKFRIEVEGDFRKEGSPNHAQFFVGFSQLEVVNFFGFGNDTRKPENEKRHGVSRRTIRVEGGYGRLFGQVLDITMGAAFEPSRTVADGNPFFTDSLTVYGGGDFGQAALFADVRLDTRDFRGAATRGARLDVRGSYYPSVLSVEESYFRLVGAGSAFFSVYDLPLHPTLALRGGATRIWGTAPYFNSALLGGAESLRGWDAERFAGDTSVFGTAELRLQITPLRIAMLGDVGALGFVDAGRVYVDGDSPGGWRLGYGGGLWLALLGPQNTVSGVMGFSEEGTAFYVWFGMPF
ncbi:MAG: BamA/TamA family outer membrane protein [Gemmatimonadota bacterium]